MKMFRSIFCVCFALTFVGGAAPATTVAAERQTIDVSGFGDVVKHWNDKYGRDRSDQVFDPSEFVKIADNILRFQNGDGGWPKSFNPLLSVDESELRPLLGRSLRRSTFDNRCTYTHIAYLAKVYQACDEERFKIAAERGLDYVVREQRSTGGWRGADVDAITYNDDVMIGVMGLLRDIDRREAHFDWLDDARRRTASGALRRAIDVTLKCQIVVGGVKTAWCQQHSHESFKPVKARSYELRSICPVESSGIVRFLMGINHPSREITDAIDSSVAWINRVKLTGIRVRDIRIDPVRFEGHTTTRDRIVVDDPQAPSIWTRYYEIETNRPFFSNRDGTKVYSLAEVHLERRSGYGWYSGAPNRLIDKDYPAWKARIEEEPKTSSLTDEKLREIRDGFASRRDAYLKQYLDVPLYEIEAGVKACRDGLRESEWIWHGEDGAKSNVPIGLRRFRRELEIPASRSVKKAFVAFAADNACRINLNGVEVGRADGFHHATLYEVTRHVRPGVNVIEVAAENLGDEPNPAGIIGFFTVSFESGVSMTIPTDGSWRVARNAGKAPQSFSSNDQDWIKPRIIGPAGCAPWGRISVGLDVRVSQYVFSRLNFAVSALALQQDMDRANDAIIEAVEAIRKERQASGEFGLHWMGASFDRIYGLFGPNGKMDRRLNDRAASAVLNLFADWARTDSQIADADPELTWRIWGSENHSAQRDATRWAAARMIAASPLQKQFRYEDGSTVAEQLAAWRVFLKRYFRERIKRGMLIEISPSGYGSRTLQGWHNIYDFTDDPELHSLAKSALDVWWAEWAQEQLGGMRGGGKTRLYPGAWALAGSDRNRAMSWFYLGQGKPAHQHETLPVIATTTYRLPSVIMDIALDPAGRGVYECKSRRLGRHRDFELSQSLSKPNEPIYDVDPDDGGIVRYSYCSPDFIIGSLMLENRPKEYWTAISQQNRWHGVIFSGPENSTLYPRCETDRSTYNAHWAIQNKGSLVVQKLRHSDETGDMRVFFSEDLKLQEQGGWIFARAADAFAAVKIVQGPWTWDDRRWLRCRREYSPVIIEVVRSEDFDNDFDAFKVAVQKQSVNVESGVLQYRGLNETGDFRFFTESERLPELNGKPIDLRPDYAFKSPFLNSDWASGVVRISKGNRSLMIDVRERSEIGSESP